MKLPRFQFRLRTLFLVVTLIALACGWAVDHAQLIRERNDAMRRADAMKNSMHTFLMPGLNANATGVLEFRSDTPPEVIEEAKRLLPKIQIRVATAN